MLLAKPRLKGLVKSRNVLNSVRRSTNPFVVATTKPTTTLVNQRLMASKNTQTARVNKTIAECGFRISECVVRKIRLLFNKGNGE